MRLSAWGREDLRTPYQAGELQIDGNRANAEGRGITVMYHNDREGMRQDFLIRGRPAGSGPLQLWVELEFDDVVMEIEPDGRGVAFGRAVPGGARVMSYGDLEVRDARGRRLQAEMVREDENLFSIVVDDTDAAYPVLVDPLSSSPDWTAESNQADSEFGRSVASAGDVNGDGYSDVIVGAPEFDYGFEDQGRAFVYHGSSSGLSTAPNWTMDGNQAGAEFGNSVATAGDVNGDGYSDVIIGAWLYTNHQIEEGRAYVYHGGPAGIAILADWTAEGLQDDATFGISVAAAGDVNGDGYGDVIVGAHAYDNGHTDEGRAYVYHGVSTGLSTSAAWVVESNQSTAYLGSSVGTAGDVNGDGYSDVIVGASHYDSGQDDEGRAFVYHGSPSGLNVSPDWTAESNQDYAWFGRSVATAGDVNGDGFSDVIVGSPWFTNGQSNEGRSYVYHGSPTGLNTSYNWIAESNQSFAEFGRSVATAGDVNGDGYSDVMVGAHRYSNDQTNEGRAYVYHGSSSGLSVGSDWTAEGNQDEAYYGYSLGTAGDVNGDGYSDVIVGAWSYSNGHTDEGRAYVYHGSSIGLAAAWTAESDQAEAYYGYSVATAGDVNGDGYSDVIVGAYEYDNDQTDEGRAYIYNGSPSGLSTSPDYTAESDQDSTRFGVSVAGAGDVNGDGYSDVIIGADLYDNSYTNEGRVFVYYGNSTDGLHMLPRQWRADLTTPVVPALKTYSQSQAGLGLLARTFFGRGDLRVQFEIKDLGTPFDGTGLTTTSWRDPGTTGTDVNATIGGLSNETMYKWRARIQYHLSSAVPQMYSRWFYQSYNGGLGEADFQVRGVDLPPDAPALSIVRLNSSTCRLSWYSVPGATSYRLYRGTAGFFLPVSPWHTVSAPGTYYDFTIGVGNPVTNYFFLCRALGNGGESEDSNRVGEFDFDSAGFSFNRDNTGFHDDDRGKKITE